MTGRAVRDHWVVCPDYAAGPYGSADAARTAIAQIEPHCYQPHAIVRQATRPVIPQPWLDRTADQIERTVL